MNWKHALIQTGITLAVIAVVYHVAALKPVSDVLGLNSKADA